MNFARCLAFVLDPLNDGQPYHVTPGDSGGPTAWGVTQKNWSRWIGRPATTADMQALTPTSVSGFYRCWFWNTVAGDRLPAGVDLMVFDHGVLHGEPSAAREIQQLVGVEVDGEIGPITCAAIAACEPEMLVERLRSQQDADYRPNPTFGRGWLARLDRRAEAALAMISPSSGSTR